MSDMYNKICNKLGFDPRYEPYVIPEDITEDDNSYPFRLLTDEELTYFLSLNIEVKTVLDK